MTKKIQNKPRYGGAIGRFLGGLATAFSLKYGSMAKAEDRVQVNFGFEDPATREVYTDGSFLVRQDEYPSRAYAKPLSPFQGSPMVVFRDGTTSTNYYVLGVPSVKEGIIQGELYVRREMGFPFTVSNAFINFNLAGGYSENGDTNTIWTAYIDANGVKGGSCVRALERNGNLSLGSKLNVPGGLGDIVWTSQGPAVKVGEFYLQSRGLANAPRNAPIITRAHLWNVPFGEYEDTVMMQATGPLGAVAGDGSVMIKPEDWAFHWWRGYFQNPRNFQEFIDGIGIATTFFGYSEQKDWFACSFNYNGISVPHFNQARSLSLDVSSQTLEQAIAQNEQVQVPFALNQDYASSSDTNAVFSVTEAPIIPAQIATNASVPELKDQRLLLQLERTAYDGRAREAWRQRRLNPNPRKVGFRVTYK